MVSICTKIRLRIPETPRMQWRWSCNWSGGRGGGYTMPHIEHTMLSTYGLQKSYVENSDLCWALWQLVPILWCLTLKWSDHHLILISVIFLWQSPVRRRDKRREIIKRKPQTIIITNASRSNSEDTDKVNPNCVRVVDFLFLTFLSWRIWSLSHKLELNNTIWTSLSIWLWTLRLSWNNIPDTFQLGALGAMHR